MTGSVAGKWSIAVGVTLHSNHNCRDWELQFIISTNALSLGMGTYYLFHFSFDNRTLFGKYLNIIPFVDIAVSELNGKRLMVLQFWFGLGHKLVLSRICSIVIEVRYIHGYSLPMDKRTGAKSVMVLLTLRGFTSLLKGTKIMCG